MRQKRLASLGASRSCLLVGSTLFAAVSFGAAALQPASAAASRGVHVESPAHNMARVPVRALSRDPAPVGRDLERRVRSDRPTLAREPAVIVAAPPILAIAPPPPPAAVVPAPPPPPPPPPPPIDDVWRSLALCESGGNWQTDTGNGYFGGLQFSLESWQNVGGAGYPDEHPSEHQVEMAKRLQARQGWDAWPVCARRLGLL